jgi:hypothetical protein
MDDSRRWQTTRFAGLALVGVAAVTSCGSSGSSATPGPGHVQRDQSVDRSAPLAISRGPESIPNPADDDLDGVDRSPIREDHGALPFLCATDPVAFDLSALQPTRGTPPAFWYAWLYAQKSADVPGFVIAYTGTGSGPHVEARVGAVRPVGPGTYAFMKRLAPTDAETVSSDANDPFRVRSTNGHTPFLTAFGLAGQRQGFYVSSISVEGHLDYKCEYLRDVVVTMSLPADKNRGQRFGNSTVSEALGPVTLDTDGDRVADSWTVTMEARALDALKFRL